MTAAEWLAALDVSAVQAAVVAIVGVGIAATLVRVGAGLVRRWLREATRPL